MDNVDRAISLFGCKGRGIPTSYLGLLLKAPHKFWGLWDSIEERFERKLAAWKE